MLPSFVEPVGDGLFAIDTGFHRPRFDAAYLMIERGRAAFIDTGTNSAIPRLLQALSALDLGPDCVDFVIPTHVHLDHAGGAGLLMQSLPQAQMWVHPRGAAHMIDPTRLYQGALAVYGQAEMDRSYGRLVAIDASRVSTSSDGMALSLAGRPIEFADTPGHALHHHCIWDERSRGWFTGDTFGLSYRDFDTSQGPWISVTSTPVQFDPVRLKQSIRRLLGRSPHCMYLTHYSRVEDPAHLGEMLIEQIDEMVTFANELRAVDDRHQALKRQLRAQAQNGLVAHGVLDIDSGLDLLSLDIELNAQGLGVWLDRQSRPH